MMLVSVVTPCYNEELTISDCVQRLDAAMKAEGIAFEHILVDNASIDNTLETLLRLKSEYDHVRVLKNEFNIGAFKSMQRGILAARGELVVPFLASDCQDPPELIPKMLSVRSTVNCDTVAGVRKIRHDNFVISRFRGLFYRIIRIATKGRYHPGSSEFRLMSTARALQLADIRDSIPFLRIYMAQTQGSVQYVEYEMAPRTAGTSSATFLPLVDDALNGIMLAAPSIFSRLLVLLIPLSLGGICVTIATLALKLFGLTHSWAPIQWFLACTAFLCVGLIQVLIGHYVYMVHSQVRSGPTATTTEL